MKKIILSFLLFFCIIYLFAEQICTVQIMNPGFAAEIYVDYGQGKIEKLTLPVQKDIGYSIIDIISYMQKLGWNYNLQNSAIVYGTRIILFFTKQ